MGNNSHKPVIRFQGFTDAWELRKLGEITVELSDYTTLNAGLPLLTSSRNGLMYQSEYRGNQTTDNKETLFSIVPLGTCTYRHMSDDDVFHLNVNTLEKGLVSREYPVFSASENNDIDFIVQHINSCAAFRSFCAEQKKGGTRTRLYYKTLCEFKMMVPSAEEQKQISIFLLSLDNLITLHQRKYQKLITVKKSMLEKMFPRDGSNNPEIRFTGFTDRWEQRKLGELAEIKDSARIPNNEWSNSGVPYIRASDITNEDISGVLFISSESYDYYKARTGAPAQGDVLFNGGGEIGKAFLNTENTPIYVQGGAVLYVRTSKSTLLDGQYLKTFFETPMAQCYIDIASAGGTMKHFTLKPSQEMPIQLPEMREQIQIGRCFRNIDNLITLHHLKLEKLKNIKQSLLQNMFV